MPLDLILTMQVQFGHAGPIWALWVMFWTILGPPGVPKRPQSGPIWHIMMYYTCEKSFRATWTLPGRLLPAGQFLPVGWWAGPHKLHFYVFLQKPPVPDFFVNCFRKISPRPFKRYRFCQWYIFFDLNFVLPHCGDPFGHSGNLW